jgi:hypothetical protein
MYLFVFTIVFTAGTLLAQQPEVKPARVEGRVLIKDSTTPVPGAQVKLAGKVATSAGDGSFVLDDIAPGYALGTVIASVPRPDRSQRREDRDPREWSGERHGSVDRRGEDSGSGAEGPLVQRNTPNPG